MIEFFSLSKLGWLLVQPVTAVLVALVVVWLLVWRGRVVFARWLIVLVAVCYGAIVFSNIGQLMLLPLENRFSVPDQPPQAIAGIIVLGGGFDGRVTQRRGGYALGESGDRFTEAVALARRLPNAPIIVSGGDASFIGTTEGDALIAPRFFEAMGVDRGRVLIEDQSRNTAENARFTAQLIERAGLPADATYIVITSAFHMPRAMESFAQTPLSILAWPVDFRTAGDETFTIGRDDPLRALSEFNLALREWIGIAVYRISGGLAASN